MNAGLPFVHTLRKQPERVAIVEGPRASIRRGELADDIVAFAAHLQRRGVAPGDRVLMQVPNGIGFATTCLGALLVGAVPLLLEPGLGAVYTDRATLAAPRWVVEHRLLRWVRRVPGAMALARRLERDLPPVHPTAEPAIVVTHRSLRRLPRASLDDLDLPERAPDDDAVIVFTGGTSARPKGVRVGMAGLEAFLRNIFAAIEDVAGEAFLADTPAQVLYGLRKEQTVHVARGRKERRAAQVQRLLRSGAVDAYFGSPYLWMEMERLPGPMRMPSSLRTVLLGSAPATPGFLERLVGWLAPRTRVRVIYGMTEVGVICVVSAETKLAYRGDGDLVGAPVPGVEVELVDIDPDSGVGEVVVHSEALFLGYLGQPPREGGLRTGDLAIEVQVDGRRMIALMGRTKDMIIRHGVNLYPLSFEARLARELSDAQGPLLAECAMIGVWNDAREDEDVVLVLEPARPFDVDALRPRIDAILGTDAKPDRVVLVERIPVTGRQNKVDKQALREQLGGSR